VGRTSVPLPTITSDVVSSAGAAPVGAEIVGASPAFALTTGRPELLLEVDVLVGSDILNPPRTTKPTIAKATIAARMARIFFMAVTVSSDWQRLH
jgi:hypothetical protein